VSTLKRIAQENSYLGPWAVRMLSRYMPKEDYSTFVQSLRKAEKKSDNKAAASDGK